MNNAESIRNILAPILHELSTPEELDNVLYTIAREATEYFKATGCRIWLVRKGDLCSSCNWEEQCKNKSRCLHLKVSYGLPISETDKRVPLEVFDENTIAQGGISDWSNLSTTIDKLVASHWAAEHSLNSFAAHPLRIGDRIVGLITVLSEKPLQPLAHSELKIFAICVSTAIRFAELTFKTQNTSDNILQKSLSVDNSRQLNLIEIAELLLSIKQFRQLPAEILKQLSKLIPVQESIFFLLEGQSLVVQGIWGYEKTENLVGLKIPLQSITTLNEILYNTHICEVTNDILPLSSKLALESNIAITSSRLALPLFQENPLGLILVASPTGVYAENEIAICVRFTKLVSPILNQLLLLEQVSKQLRLLQEKYSPRKNEKSTKQIFEFDDTLPINPVNLTEQNNKLLQKISELKSHTTELEQNSILFKEKDDSIQKTLELKLQQEETEKEILKNQLETINKKFNEVNIEYSCVTEKIFNLENDLLACQTKLAHTEQENQQQKEQILELKTKLGEMEQLQTNFQELSTAYAVATSLVKQSQNELSTAQVALQTAASELKNAQQRVILLEAQAEQIKSEQDQQNSQYLEQVSNLEIKLQNLNSLLVNEKYRSENLQTMYSELLSIHQDAKGLLDQTKETQKYVEVTNENKISELNNQYKKLQILHQELVEQFSTTTKQQTYYEQTQKYLQQRLDELECERSNWQILLDRADEIQQESNKLTLENISLNKENKNGESLQQKTEESNLKIISLQNELEKQIKLTTQTHKEAQKSLSKMQEEIQKVEAIQQIDSSRYQLPEKSLNLMRCLLASDALENLQKIQEVLTNNFNDVVYAKNDEQLLSELFINPPDIIILHFININNENIQEILHRIRRNPDWEKIPIVVLTISVKQSQTLAYLKKPSYVFSIGTFEQNSINSLINRISSILQDL